jgi:hypothetical protein
MPTRVPDRSRIVAVANVPTDGNVEADGFAGGRAGAVGEGDGGEYTGGCEHVITPSADVAMRSARPNTDE